MKYLTLCALLWVACLSNAILFSPYKDITINLDWNTNVLSTMVTGSRTSVLSVLPSSGAKVLTWAFATGTCGSESWGGVNATALVDANVKSWVSAGYKYIISTGGASGSFKCTSDAGFQTFIERYNSAALLGFDFDIEGGMSQQDTDSLVQVIKNAQSKYPNLRFSFTIATLGGDSNPILGGNGIMVMNSIKSHGLSNYFVNLMVMDYGSPNPANCVLGSDGLCEMGLSAVKAATSFSAQYGVPLSQVELTPMIGGNDTPNETFTLEDADTVATFALQNGLVAVHHWSFDRDTDCTQTYASPTCNSYGKAGTLGFTKRFSNDLHV